MDWLVASIVAQAVGNGIQAMVGEKKSYSDKFLEDLTNMYKDFGARRKEKERLDTIRNAQGLMTGAIQAGSLSNQQRSNVVGMASDPFVHMTQNENYAPPTASSDSSTRVVTGEVTSPRQGPPTSGYAGIISASPGSEFTGMNMEPGGYSQNGLPGEPMRSRVKQEPPEAEVGFPWTDEEKEILRKHGYNV